MSTKVTSNVLVDQGSAHQLEDFERNGETEPSDACFRAEQFTFSFGNRQGQVSSFGTDQSKERRARARMPQCQLPCGRDAEAGGNLQGYSQEKPQWLGSAR